MLQFLRELHFIEATTRWCTGLRRWLQFLRELHFIEARRSRPGRRPGDGRSSFGSRASLRLPPLRGSTRRRHVAVSLGTALY